MDERGPNHRQRKQRADATFALREEIMGLVQKDGPDAAIQISGQRLGLLFRLFGVPIQPDALLGSDQFQFPAHRLIGPASSQVALGRALNLIAESLERRRYL